MPSDVDHNDLICHVGFPFVYVIQHLFGVFCPDLDIFRIPEQSNTDDNVAIQRQSFLRLHAGILEALFFTGVLAFFCDHRSHSSLAISPLYPLILPMLLAV